MKKYYNPITKCYVDEIVEIDDNIADTILELNQKGYTTYACCGGHSDDISYISEAPLNFKDEVIKEGYTILGEDNEKLYYAQLNTHTNVYVKFDGPYNFSDIPEGFNYETAEEAYRKFKDLIAKFDVKGADDIIFGDSIHRMIGLTKDGKLRPRVEIDEEIRLSNERLLKWAKSLEPLNKTK